MSWIGIVIVALWIGACVYVRFTRSPYPGTGGPTDGRD